MLDKMSLLSHEPRRMSHLELLPLTFYLRAPKMSQWARSRAFCVIFGARLGTDLQKGRGCARIARCAVPGVGDFLSLYCNRYD